MAVYVQIGKNPRMLINAKLADVRKDFIEQMPSWKRLVPIYFYPSAKTDNWTGVLLPRRWTDGDYLGHSFYWIGQYEYWSFLDGNCKLKVGWDWLMALIKKYEELGFKL